MATDVAVAVDRVQRIGIGKAGKYAYAMIIAAAPCHGVRTREDKMGGARLVCPSTHSCMHPGTYRQDDAWCVFAARQEHVCVDAIHHPLRLHVFAIGCDRLLHNP